MKELNEVKSDLESVRSQLETMAIRVSQVPTSTIKMAERSLYIVDIDTDIQIAVYWIHF